MKVKKKSYCALLSIVMIFFINSANASEYINTLPEINTNADLVNLEYYVNVIENGKRLSKRTPIKIIGNNFYVARPYISLLFIPSSKLTNKDEVYIDISRINGVVTYYDKKIHALILNIPPSWLPAQNFGHRSDGEYNYTMASGLAIDYDAYASKSRSMEADSLFIGGRLFKGAGYFYSSGVANHYGMIHSDFTENTYTRYLSYYQHYYTDSDTSLILGDFVSSNGSWDSSVRMGGASFQKDFDLEPDKNIYQSPSVKGTAKAPSIVDIYMDNRKISSEKVGSGPYQISDIPFINGSGQVSVVTTDRLGNKTKEQIQLYKSPYLMMAGLSQFAVNVGYLRYNYGFSDSCYRNPAVSGFIRSGVNDTLTDSLYWQSALKLKMIGAGINYLLRPIGVFSVTGSVSSENKKNYLNGERGGKVDFNYNYANRFLNLSYDHTSYTEKYSDLSSYGLADNGLQNSNPKYVDQIWLSRQLFNSSTLGFGFFYIQPFNQHAYSMDNISLATETPLNGQISLTMSGYHDANGNNLMTMLDLSLPLGDSTHAQFTSSRSKNGIRNDVQLSLGSYGSQQTHSDLEISRDENNMDYQRADIYHSGKYANISGGMYGYREKTWWLEGAGTVTWIDGALQLNPESNGSFVLVNTGVPNMPYYSGGALQGYTNKSGFGFINNIQPGIPSVIAIDPTHLPANYHIDSFQKKVKIYPKSGAEVIFHVIKSSPARFRLLDIHHHPIALGSVFKNENNGKSSFIGYDGSGFLYIKNNNQIPLSVYTGVKGMCHAILNPEDYTKNNIEQPTYICQ